MAIARFFGSSLSRGLGRPCPTSQNGQRRVQISPMIIKVAVPPEKHSPRFGQAASSHTLCSLCLRSSALTRATSGEVAMGTRIHSGLRGISSVGRIFTGIRATFSAPRSFTPVCKGCGRPVTGNGAFMAWLHTGMHSGRIHWKQCAQLADLTGNPGLDRRIARMVEDVADPGGQRTALGYLQATGGHRRGADTQARGHER